MGHLEIVGCWQALADPMGVVVIQFDNYLNKSRLWRDERALARYVPRRAERAEE